MNRHLELGDDIRPGPEHVSHVRVDRQVGIPLPVAGLRVGEPAEGRTLARLSIDLRLAQGERRQGGRRLSRILSRNSRTMLSRPETSPSNWIACSVPPCSRRILELPNSKYTRPLVPETATHEESDYPTQKGVPRDFKSGGFTGNNALPPSVEAHSEKWVP